MPPVPVYREMLGGGFFEAVTLVLAMPCRALPRRAVVLSLRAAPQCGND